MDNKKDYNHNDVREAAEWVGNAVVSLVIVITIITFIIAPFFVSGYSMYPTLRDGQLGFVQKVGYSLHQGDIVIIQKDGFPYEDKRACIVKRVIATGGQKIDIDYDKNTVTVDGNVLDEYYINVHNLGLEEYDYGDDPMIEFDDMDNAHITVPENSIFVMGDNRNDSSDSRGELGPVDRSYVVGKVLIKQNLAR